MYYVLSVSDDYPDNYYFEYDHENSPNYLSFNSGKFFNKSSTIPTFRSSRKFNVERLMEYDFFMSDGGDFISSKFANLIQNFALDDVQLVEANVCVNNKNIRGFKIPNIVSVVACIDIGKSTYTPVIKSDPEGPKSFTRYEFIDGSLGARKIVRCKEDLDTIVVSEDFVKACESAGIKGVAFLRNGVSDYE